MLLEVEWGGVEWEGGVKVKMLLQSRMRASYVPIFSLITLSISQAGKVVSTSR